MELVPELVSFSLPERFSFSQMRSAENCLFSALPVRCLRLSHPWPSVRLGRSQLLGLLYHSMLELISKNGIELSQKQLSYEFSETLKACSARSIFTIADMNQWAETSILLQSLIDRVCRKPHANGDRSEVRALIEKDFHSKDNLLTGRIDHLFLKDDSPWILTEFKSSKCLIGESIRQDYIRQLHFYSSLIEDNFGRTPSLLRIVSIQDGTVEVSLSRTLMQETVYGAKVLYDLLQFRLQKSTSWTSSLKPGKHACSQCSKRLICPAFQSIHGKIELDGPIHVIGGTVIECSQGDGVGWIKLHVSMGSLPLGEQQIFDFDKTHFPSFTKTVGERIVMTDLHQRNAVVRMTPTSQILRWSGNVH